MSPLHPFAAVLGSVFQIDEAFSFSPPSTNLDAPPHPRRLPSFHDLLASRYTKGPSKPFCNTAPPVVSDPSECLTAPPTDSTDNDLCRNFLLSSITENKVKPKPIDDTPSSPPTPPAVSGDSDINALIYCPFHRRLVGPTRHLKNPWSTWNDSNPESNLAGSAANCFTPVVTLEFSSSKEILVDAASFKFSAPLYSSAAFFPRVHALVHQPRTYRNQSS
jgi:hypothetical protein